MKFTPHSYQIRGAETLLENPGAGLFLDPGLGKTATVLMAYAALYSGRIKRMLVVAPIKPMMTTWPNEVKRWDNFNHFKTCILHGPKKNERLKEDADIYLVNPEGLPWLAKNFDFMSMVDILCIDESTKFKNSQSARVKALKPWLPSFHYRWILTGTPAPNGLMDLFSQSYIMDHGKALGKYITHYRKRYFFQSGYGGYTWLPFQDSLDEITEALSDHVLQLNAEDYLVMPELMNIKREVDIGEVLDTVYKPMEKEFLTQAGKAKDIFAPNAASAGNKCRQIANGTIYDNEGGSHVVHSKKMEALDEIVEETWGHPLLIIYEFTCDRLRIQDRLGAHAKCITGMSEKSLNKTVDDFNNGRLSYMIAHSGSLHGLNVQGRCFHLVWYSIPWSLENYQQAVYRLYRQGQTSKIVFVYHLVATGTIDERVMDVISDKKATQDSINRRIAR